MRKIWSDEDVKYLMENYHNTEAKDIAEFLQLSIRSVYTKAYILGVKRDAGSLSERMKKYCRENPNSAIKLGWFPKGNIPHNKGQKMPEDVYEKCKGTMFKKRHISSNALAIGTEVVRHCRVYDIIYVKVPNKKKLVPKHRYIWEQANGTIPKGFNVSFKDGNTKNCELANLDIISDEELMRRNNVHNYPPEIKRAIHTLGVLNRHINKQLKQNNDETD
jgi:hypothetical protein